MDAIEQVEFVDPSRDNKVATKLQVFRSKGSVDKRYFGEMTEFDNGTKPRYGGL
jgi:hypothetical protein